MPVSFWHIGIDAETNKIFNFFPIDEKIWKDDDNSYREPSLRNKRIIGVFIRVVTKNRKADYFTDITLAYHLFDEEGKSKRDRELEQRVAVGQFCDDDYSSKVVIMQPKVKLSTEQRDKLLAYFNKRSPGVWVRTSAKVKIQLT